MSNLRIDIASEFTGKAAFQKAEAATSSLDKAVDKLGKRLAGAFSAYKVAQFAKDSVKAFAEDQKAAAVLAKTLENVNQGYATDMVESYIAKTEALYGVLDDKLRPAFSKLVVATGDATKSQQLLQTALDISAGTGKDLESVTAALSKAYLGNNTALQRLGVGLSKADLQGKNFNDIITILNQNFAGQAATAADTYGGKLDRLNVAFNNMKETIGKGIIDSFTQLDGDAGFNGVITKMGQLATYIANITVGLGVIANQIKSALPSVGNGAIGKILGDVIFPFKKLLDPLASLGAKAQSGKAQSSVVTNFLLDMNKIAAGTAKANSNAKTLLTTTKALTKEQKDQLALKKASLEIDKALGIFNLEKIELAAASMSKQSAEDYARIKLKQDILALQDAINAGDAESATKLAAIVEEDYKRVWAYQAINIALGIQQGVITNIKNAATLIPTNLNLINLDNLKSALDYIKEMLAQLTSMPSLPNGSGVVNKSGIPFNPPKMEDKPSDLPSEAWKKIIEDYNNAWNEEVVVSVLSTDYGGHIIGTGNAADLSALGGISIPTLSPNAFGPQAVTITINDNTSGLIQVVTDATQQASANGINTRLVRNTGGLSW